MVRAVLSSKYTPISVPTVYGLATKFLNEKYPKAIFSSGYYSHEFCKMTWDLAAYRDEILSQCKTLRAGNIEPKLFVQSSDVSVSSVLVRPSLGMGGVDVPLLEAETTRHLGKNETVVGRVSQSFEVVMAGFSDAAKAVDMLNDIVLKNPYYTLLRAFKKVKWPLKAKKYALEAADSFKDMLDDDLKTTAYDAYLAIVDAYSYFVRDQASDQDGIFLVADSAARSIKINWAEIDLPYEFSY